MGEGRGGDPAGETRRGRRVFGSDEGNPALRSQYHSCTDLRVMAPGLIPDRSTSMTCSDFVTRFTNYLDGSEPPEESKAIEEHLRGCDSCARYRNVLAHGAAVLRSLPEPELREDFEPRLRHRLYHVDDQRSVAAHQSGAPALAVLGIAILLTALAWAPALRGRSTDVVLEPIVVDRAPRRAVRFTSLAAPGTFSTKNPADLDNGLWDNTLLYEYSPLSRRYPQRTRLRRAVETDR